MKWITHSHVDLGRAACAWLIRRFVDSQAEFLFASEKRLGSVAAEAGALPFGSTEVEFGRKESNTAFESVLLKYELSDPALLRMARMIEAALMQKEGADPLNPGLAALAAGFSLLFPDDDENLTYQFPVFDALFTWCRLQEAQAASSILSPAGPSSPSSASQA